MPHEFRQARPCLTRWHRSVRAYDKRDLRKVRDVVRWLQRHVRRADSAWFIDPPYTWDRCAAETLRVFRTLCGSRYALAG